MPATASAKPSATNIYLSWMIARHLPAVLDIERTQCRGPDLSPQAWFSGHAGDQGLLSGRGWLW
jgi:hypothetical protein